MKKKLWILSFIMAMVFMMAGANLASAFTITATEWPGSSSAVINPGNKDNTGGMTSWIIGDSSSTSQLNLQWFWFQIGDYTTRLGDLQQTGVDGGGNATYTDLNISGAVDSDGDQLDITYLYGPADGQGVVNPATALKIKTTYLINGGINPPYGHIHEDVQFINRTSDPLGVRLYEYNDFNLAGTPENDTIVADNDNKITQYEGNMSIAEVSLGDPNATTSYEIGERWVGDGSGVLEAVIAGDDLTPLGSGFPQQITPTDAAWAFSWDFSLSASTGSWSVSKDKDTYTPIPTTLLLFGSGLFSLIGVGIRRRKS